MEWRNLLIASLAFGLYVICPRMSAMMVQQAKVRGLNLYAVIVLGALISIPLFVILSRILGSGWPGDIRLYLRLKKSAKESFK